MNLKEVSFWATTILIIGLSIYVLTWIKSDSFECVSNTPIYLIKNLEKSNEGNVTCSCFVYNKRYDAKESVLLDNQGFHPMNQIVQEMPDLNYFNNTKN